MEKIFEDVQDVLEHTKFHCLIQCRCESCGVVFNTTKESVKRNQKIICPLCKRKNTNLKKYGKEFFGLFGSEEHDKAIKEKYGVENVAFLDEVVQKRKETCKKVYGGIAPACSKEIREKMKKTCKKRFGVEFSSQSSEIKEKVKETNLKKYGVEFSSQNEDVKEKQKQTKKEKYGDEYFNNHEKCKRTKKEK